MKKHPIAGATARARHLRRNIAEAETRLWQMLRSHEMNGYKFRRQVPFGRNVAYFACHQARLVIEIDGGQHDPLIHGEAERTRLLKDQGYRVLRLWNNEVLANLEGVHQLIADALGTVTPTQTLPHRGGGLRCVDSRLQAGQ